MNKSKKVLNSIRTILGMEAQIELLAEAILEDGTKVDSVANRLLLFNSSLNHNSSTTTNAKGRYNININYI